jgi:hypothetical protein
MSKKRKKILDSIKDGQCNWTVTLDSQPHLFNPSHPHYSALVQCVHSGDEDEFINLLNTGFQVENWSEGDFEFRDGLLYFEGEQVAKDPTNRIVECLQQGFPHQFMMNYLTNLYDNVSERAVQESYKWSSHKGLPITEDGMMVGYKGVRTYAGETIQGKNGEIKEGDLVDIYTGNSFRNNVGDTASMKRRQVCDDHTQGCDTGLHVGTYDYACNWAGNTGVVVLVKFNPKDIVSVPSDCNCEKMRVSSYEVISVAREQLEEAVYTEDEYFNDQEDYLDELEDGDVINDSW